MDLTVFVVSKSHDSCLYDPGYAAAVGMTVDPESSGNSSSSDGDDLFSKAKFSMTSYCPTKGDPPACVATQPKTLMQYQLQGGHLLRRRRKSLTATAEWRKSPRKRVASIFRGAVHHTAVMSMGPWSHPRRMQRRTA